MSSSKQRKAEAELFKQKGNSASKRKEYNIAKKYYDKAIGMIFSSLYLEIYPYNFVYYGNRSVCDMFLELYGNFSLIDMKIVLMIVR